VFGVRVNGNITYWSSSVINVSSNGPAFNLLPITDEVKNQTLLPGAAPQKMSFSIQDAGGNALARSATVAIRVRIVPRLNTTTSRSVASMAASSGKGKRRLLQVSNSSADACALDSPLEFTFIQNSSSSQITAGPEFLCRVGVNDIFFDVGTYSEGSFLSTSLNAFSLSVTVVAGEFNSFLLVNFESSFVVQSYSLIDSLEIMFLDAGLNEVSGNATMTLLCMNSSTFLYPAASFTAVSNATFKAYAPAFFVYILDWMPSESPSKVRLTTANSSVPQYGANIVTLQLNRTCSPGHRLNHGSLPDLHAWLKFKKHNDTAGVISSPCVQCSNGTISSRLDSQICR
jgi:hypothetical protein